MSRLEDLQLDLANANTGTLRGQQLLDRSLEEHGAARSIVVDKHGTVLAGNKTLETSVARGLSARIVPTDGRTLVVVQRTDLDATDPKTRELVYLDNRSAEVGLAWDLEQLEEDLMQGVELGGMFTAAEREKLLLQLSEAEVKAKVVFDTPAQFQQFLDFLTHAAKHFPRPSLGASVAAWAADQMVQAAAAQPETLTTATTEV